MNRTFKMADFEEAIKAKDYIKIKNFIINSIRNNPGFQYGKEVSCSEAEAAFNKLKECKNELPGLFSPYCLQGDEIEFNENNKTAWTYEYFIRQTFLLGENFCDERFAHVKEIGKYLKKNVNFTAPQEAEEGFKENIRNNVVKQNIERKTEDTNPIWIIVVLAIIIVGLLVVFLKKIL